MSSTLYRGVITKLTAKGAWVSVPKLGGTASFGPCEVTTSDYSIGEKVLVSHIGDVVDNLVILGRLTRDAQEEILDGNEDNKQIVTGSKNSNAALASLIDALVALGLITDSTTD